MTRATTQLGNVLAWLRAREPGTQVTTQALVEAVSHKGEAKVLIRYLQPAVDAGLLRRQRIAFHGSTLWWSLAKFEPIHPEFEIEDEEWPRRVAEEIQPRPGPWFPGLAASELTA